MPDDELVPCAAMSFCRPDLANWLDEPEGARVPAGLQVFDAHVHLFPPRVFHSIWRWFDKNAWAIRYQLQTEQVIEFLAARGVSKLVALHYSHKPGMAAVLNQFVADAARGNPRIIPFATVMPGEPDAREVLRDAFGRLGLRGVKLHCHVQQMPADDPRMLESTRSVKTPAARSSSTAAASRAFPPTASTRGRSAAPSRSIAC